MHHRGRHHHQAQIMMTVVIIRCASRAGSSFAAAFFSVGVRLYDTEKAIDQALGQFYEPGKWCACGFECAQTHISCFHLIFATASAALALF